MKRLSLGTILSLLALTISTNVFAAEKLNKMDLSDTNAVIAKLAQILPALQDDPKKQNTVQIRLADLYAERARYMEVAAGEKNCTDCKEAKSDRLKAIELYSSGLAKSDLETQKKGYPQLAYLLLATDQSAKATQVYQGMLKNPKLKSLHPKAHLGLGDIYYTDAKYKAALVELNLAKRNADKNDVSYITYRSAWSKLNMGETAVALTWMRTAINQATANKQTAFRKDLMRDYATMLARSNFGTNEVNAFAKMSPEADRAENLKFLGDEAERLGNKRGAILIWAQYSRSGENDQAEVLLKFALNYYDLDDQPKALQYLGKTTKALKDEKCEDCKKVEKDWRAFLVNWNKKEKTEPSKNLLQAYSLYLEASPEDFEVLIWAGQVAQAQNNPVLAYSFYDRAAVAAYKQKKVKETESTSTVAMEVADSTNRVDLREKSLNRYLELNPKGPKRNLAKYQLAYIAFNRKQYDDAASEFKALALNKEWNDMNLRVQSADLNLDALTILKQDKEIRSNANLFAREFKTKAIHFSEIGRKVTMNILVKLVTDPNGSRSEIRSEIEILRSYPIAHLSNTDKIAHNKNLILAAEKVGDVNTVAAMSSALLKTPGVSAADEEFAKRSLLWVAELKLEFKAAYKIAMSMKMADQKGAQRDLRLGLLAELAGINPEGHFNDFIKHGGSVRKSNELRVKMIRRASNKWAKLNSYLPKLRQTPDVLASITLELHLVQPNPRQVAQILNIRGVNKTPEGFYLVKLRQRDEYKSYRQSIANGKLDRRNDRALQRSMKSRIAVLEQLKRRYDNALATGDIPLQAMILSTIETENRRFYRQIQAMPAPRGLRAAEKVQYQTLLDQQSKPFLTTADEAKTNLEKTVPDNSKAMSELEKALQSSDTLQRRLATNELRTLRPYMSNGQISDFKDVLEDTRVSSREIENIRKEIRMNPLNTSVLKELRELEARRANGPLIAYLDERIEQLKTDARR